MKYLKLYENFQEEDIHKICKRYNITNYKINDDFSVDVDGDVNLNFRSLTELPLKFRKVTGDFSCYENELTSLKGCPMYVGRDFDCRFNNLTSLIGSPKEVVGNFDCGDNKLTSLEGCPIEVLGFDCSNNELITLKGCPTYIGSDFYCPYNQLTSLEGLKHVGGDFEYWENPVYEIYKLFLDHTAFMDSFEYNYFRGGNKINKIRLTQALLELDLECPDKIEGYVWE